jgi:hypothetical protein
MRLEQSITCRWKLADDIELWEFIERFDRLRV